MSILIDIPQVAYKTVALEFLKDDRRYHCSSCDGIAPKGYRWSFCPECGADMKEANNAD